MKGKKRTYFRLLAYSWEHFVFLEKGGRLPQKRDVCQPYLRNSFCVFLVVTDLFIDFVVTKQRRETLTGC